MQRSSMGRAPAPNIDTWTFAGRIYKQLGASQSADSEIVRPGVFIHVLSLKQSFHQSPLEIACCLISS